MIQTRETESMMAIDAEEEEGGGTEVVAVGVGSSPEASSIV